VPVNDAPFSRGQALVVGASSDIGRAIAVTLAQLGFELTLWGQNRDKLATRWTCTGATSKPFAVAQIDVTRRSQLSSAVQDLTSRAPLTAVVWAAGLFERLPT